MKFFSKYLLFRFRMDKRKQDINYKKKFSKFLMMYLDLDKNKLNVEQKLSKFNRLYDYIIIGTGPAASVILNNLIKKKEDISDRERWF